MSLTKLDKLILYFVGGVVAGTAAFHLAKLTYYTWLRRNGKCNIRLEKFEEANKLHDYCTSCGFLGSFHDRAPEDALHQLQPQLVVATVPRATDAA